MRKASKIIGISEAQVNHAEKLPNGFRSYFNFKVRWGLWVLLHKFQSMLDGEIEIPEHNLSQCIEILKRSAPDKLRTVKTILQSF